MTVHRLIRFIDAAPGDRVTLTAVNGDTQHRIVVESVRWRYLKDIEGLTRSITAVGGDVFDEFRCSTVRGVTKLAWKTRKVVEDDTVALREDIDLVSYPARHKVSPSEETYKDALSRVLAVARNAVEGGTGWTW